MCHWFSLSPTLRDNIRGDLGVDYLSSRRRSFPVRPLDFASTFRRTILFPKGPWSFLGYFDVTEIPSCSAVANVTIYVPPFPSPRSSFLMLH